GRAAGDPGAARRGEPRDGAGDGRRRAGEFGRRHRSGGDRHRRAGRRHAGKAGRHRVDCLEAARRLSDRAGLPFRRKPRRGPPADGGGGPRGPGAPPVGAALAPRPETTKSRRERRSYTSWLTACGVSSNTTHMEITATQQAILALIAERIEAEGMPPSQTEIARAFGFKGVRAAQYHLEALEAAGAIERIPGRARGIRVLRAPEAPQQQLQLDGDALHLPVLGQ